MTALRAHAPRMARADRVAMILDAAHDAFTQGGFEQTSVAAIAARIAVVEGTIYKYFDSKRDLLLAVLARWYRRLLEDGEALCTPDGNPVDTMAGLIRLHLQAIHDEPLLCHLMFREFRGAGDYEGSTLHQLNRRYTGLLTRVIRDGMDDGSFRAQLPVALLRDTIYGAIEHHSWHYLSGRGALDVEPTAAALMDLLLQGIGTSRPAAPH
ncbi:TetR/AcrR family transcriptional regulator [Algiphilus sp.]|uniref:TetR/AcrR family transcriptional regulator n=1 Tax=Algiphilus sp. TaxID=1872431 RepID=UPI001CA719B0|nr:TetR/AcrR family transcriptional regulator [Algiphilus sp.]MBY8965780.1 TetR family transcriptional regulator [Algiphilus acroporae]MCI5062713.1 TetR/AcrR family transcriptional regulator [Algiphilus sp.]MCI5103007.1 TetR/AcrR family transcriptional regulator [Algiphilus sp.]MCR9091472.1 TetR/AcrR family transcriptional regulator [Pseudomonadota bacterium]